MTILEILDASTLDWREADVPDEIKCNCPFCVENDETPDTRYRLGINVKEGKANCFNCGWHSDSYVFIARELARVGEVDMSGDRVTKEEKRPVKKRKAPAPTYLDEMPAGYEAFNWSSSFEHPARDYLMNRGITRAQIEHWKIGWAMTCAYAYRVIVPVIMDGQIAGVVGRDYTGLQELRYRNSESLRGVFGCTGRHRSAILVEGAMDALRVEPLAWKGGEDAICMFGSNLSEDQIAYLKRHYDRITALPDHDAPGCKGARGACEQLSVAGIQMYVSVPDTLDGTDPGSQSHELLLRRRRTARPWATGVERLLKMREAFG